MEGWWCVRYGDALAWVEAPSEAAAVRRSLDLHCLGDWTDDERDLVVFPQDAYQCAPVGLVVCSPSLLCAGVLEPEWSSPLRMFSIRNGCGYSSLAIRSILERKVRPPVFSLARSRPPSSSNRYRRFA